MTSKRPEAPRIAVRVHHLSQLFETLDPSPFRDQDLAPDAEQYIVDSAKELPRGSVPALHVYLDELPYPSDQRSAEIAIQAHFARHALHLRRVVRDLLRDGVLSLAIGIAFLASVVLVGQLVMRIAGTNPWSTLARESLLIGGWVAMWRPLEIFLYAWWPVARERVLNDRLSRMSVVFAHAEPPEPLGKLEHHVGDAAERRQHRGPES